MAKGDDIQERLVALVASVVTFCNDLPKGTAGSHLADQLLRSGTSPAPDCAEARAAESDRDVVHKLRIVLKELTETEVWLHVLVRTNIVAWEAICPMREECNALARVITTSIRSMKQRGVNATEQWAIGNSLSSIVVSKCTHQDSNPVPTEVSKAEPRLTSWSGRGSRRRRDPEPTD
jgi:four helix bundle protein